MQLAFLLSSYLMLAVAIVVAALSVWALVDCLMRPADRFAQEGKLSKGAWTGITGAATLVTVLAVFSSGFTSLFTLAAAIAAGVYLADVRPAVSGKGGYGGYGGYGY